MAQPCARCYRRPMTNLILILAQLCIAEVGFPSGHVVLDECQAMWRINHERAEQWQENREGPWWSATDVLDVSWRYNSAFKCMGRKCDTPRMRWVRGLNMQSSQPPGWPTGISWVAGSPGGSLTYRQVWLKVIERAEWWVANDRPWPRRFSSCARRVTDYGGHMDDPRKGSTMCWSVLNCGPTRQIYWRGVRCQQPRA